MWKVLIADDEPKIRKGLKASVDWKSLDMEVCDMASNGKELLQMVEKYQPNVCLVDICMPLMDGLSALEEIHRQCNDMLCIVITGYDDFEYAQKAISMHVYDYLLKPINEMKLYNVLEKAKQKLNGEYLVSERLKNAEAVLNKNINYLREQYIVDLIMEHITKEEAKEIAPIYKMDYMAEYYVMKLAYIEEIGIADSKLYSHKLFEFAIKNIFDEILCHYGTAYTVIDSRESLISLLKIENENQFDVKKIKQEITDSVEEFLRSKVMIVDGRIHDLFELKEIYEKWDENAYENISSVVASVKNYIDANYNDVNLSVAKTAEACNLNSSYMSRIFKSQVGSNVVDYISKVRIMRSLELLKNTNKSIRAISDQVGYRSQHYYCVAFKKILGVTPTEYRKKF